MTTYQKTMGMYLKEFGVTKYPDWLNTIKVKHEPMPHQGEGVKNYLHHSRWLDAGEPGCGKTMPAHFHGILMASLGNKVVYTMPPKLIDQFYDELHEWFLGVGHFLRIERLDGTGASQEKKIKSWNGKWPDILLLSYDGYRKYNDINKKKKVGSNQWYDSAGARITDPETWKGEKFTKDGRPVNNKGYAPNDKHRLLSKLGYNVFFFDEAHALCGLDSIIGESVFEASKDDVQTFLMTGTPVPTEVGNAYGLIRLVNPEAYSCREAFERQHAIKRPMKIRTGINRYRRVNVIEGWKGHDKIRAALFKYASRVQKRDVVKMDKPLITDVPVRLTGKHAALYKTFLRDRFAVVGDTILSPESHQEALHMSLNLISCPSAYDKSLSMKNDLYDAFQATIDQINPKEHKVVVFAYHRMVIDFLAEQLKEAGYKPAVVNGSTANSDAEVKRFKHDDDCRVIVLNWESGGAGLNLQMSSHVIFYECPGVKAAKQGIARCDRTGQKETVNVYFMRVLNTLSDKRFSTLLEREEDINGVMKDEHDLLYKLIA